MQYRQFGKLDWKVSALGFGAMRLPIIGEDPSKIDEPEAIKMIRYAVDHGVNYIDTAYFYHMNKSEILVGKALKDGYRQKVKLATKLPCDMVESAKDFDRFFNEQLKRLDTKPDFYLLHGLGAHSWHKVRDLGVMKWAEKRQADDYFDQLAFSFHDEYDAFKEIVDAYDNWTFAQVMYNYIDVNSQATSRGVKYAADKGLGIVVMEPLRGGVLARTPLPEIAKVWETAPRKLNYPEWGLQWLWNQPEISVVLSGMTTMQQVKDNIVAANRSGVGTLNPAELAVIDKVREAYRGLYPVPCTACRYCQPCPNDVDIPRIFEIYNDAVAYNIQNVGRMRYSGPRLEGHRVDKCTECNQCVEACPQRIAIPDWLKKAEEFLGPPK